MHARYAVSFQQGAPRHTLRDRAAAAGLEARLEASGMLVLADPQTSLIASRDRTLIGQIFSGDGQRLADLNSAFSGLEPTPRAGCWGNFIVLSPGKGAPHIYRDPSGSIPLFQLRAETSDVFVSDAELACSLGLLERPELDLGFAVHWLQFPFLRSGRTGIRGVRELLPGCVRRRTAAGWVDEPGWRPWDHCSQPRRLSDFGQSVEELRGTALKSIAAQVNGAEPLLQLSGGLDSSIIAASLSHAGIGFTSVNFASRSSDGDERRHARAVAQRFGSPLTEILEDELDRAIRTPAERKFRPGSNPVLVPLDDAIEQHRSEVGAELLLDGGGGDNLFCYLTGASPAFDALLTAGPGQALRTCADIAERTGCTIWDVASNAMGRASPSGWWRWKEDRSFLSRAALLPRRDPHPWLEAPGFRLPGKREHVASIVHIQHFLDRRARFGSALLHPLMAQPLLELCLAIPSWQWARGGIDRAVARRAFNELLPATVIERRTKGSLQGLFHRFFTSLSGELRELLLSGRLVALGIADASALDQAFANGDWNDEAVQMRLSEMAALDLWLQSWNA